MEERRLGSGHPSASVPPSRSLRGCVNYDHLLDKMDQRVRAFIEALQAEGRYPLQPFDPGEGSVRYKRAAATVFAPFGEASERMHTLLSKREELLGEFGGECDRIAYTRALCSLMLAALGAGKASDPGVDARLRRCMETCDSVEAVLADCGLQEVLLQAQERWEHIARGDDLAKEVALSGLPPEPNSGLDIETRRWRCLERIDEPGPDDDVPQLMDELFKLYGSGHEVLEGRGVPGSSYSLAVDEMRRYVQYEWNKREERLKAKFGQRALLGSLSDEFAAEWVQSAVDPDGDGRITKDKARVGFKMVVDEVDPPRASSQG